MPLMPQPRPFSLVRWIPLLLAACVVSWTGALYAQIGSDQLRQSLQPTADVNDFAGILTPAERAALEQKCKELRQKSGAQLAVVTLKSLQGG
jgi:uncharacterized membrane protein YgcG